MPSLLLHQLDDRHINAASRHGWRAAAGIVATFLTALLPLLAVGCQSASRTTGNPKSTPSLAAADRGPDSTKAQSTRYVFGWGDRPSDLAEPRGGTSRGASVTLAPPVELPLRAIASAASDFERDRAAILALAGDYRVSFHFMETLGLLPGYETEKSYHSWGTEEVRVLEDTGNFISLQHTLVMFFQNDDGSMSEPMIVKHWRQDWTYEDNDLHTFRGERTWARERRSVESVVGAWTQAVFQVDDSPRYEAFGRWKHEGNRSIWSSEATWRPLPRREFSVRSDYGVLESSHRIVITPTGWLHEQNNWKRVAGDTVAGPGLPAEASAKAGQTGPGSTTPATAPAASDESSSPRYLAHEYGLDRYERITAPSLAAADEYWSKTGAYWAEVRRAWRRELEQHDRFTLRAEVDGRRLFEDHFAYADKLAEGGVFDSAAAAAHAHETIARFLQVPEGTPLTARNAEQVRARSRLHR